MKHIANEREEVRTQNLVSASIEDANISNALVMLPRFFVLSTSKSYNFWSMFTTSESFLAIFASLAVSNASISVLHARVLLSWISTRARYSKLKSFTKSAKLSPSLPA